MSAADVLSNVYELACLAAAKQPQGQMARAMEIAAARCAALQPQAQTMPKTSAGEGYVSPSPPSSSQAVDAIRPMPASDDAEIPQPPASLAATQASASDGAASAGYAQAAAPLLAADELPELTSVQGDAFVAPPPPPSCSPAAVPLPATDQAELAAEDGSPPPPPALLQGFAPSPLAADAQLFLGDAPTQPPGPPPPCEGAGPLAPAEDVRKPNVEAVNFTQVNPLFRRGAAGRTVAEPVQLSVGAGLPFAPAAASPHGSMHRGKATPRSARLPPLGPGEQTLGQVASGDVHAAPRGNARGSSNARSASHRAQPRVEPVIDLSAAGAALVNRADGLHAAGDGLFTPAAPASTSMSPRPKPPSATHGPPTVAKTNQTSRGVQLPQLSVVQAKGNQRSAAPAKGAGRAPPALMV